MSKKAERDVILGHEDEADGIQEYDNPLPDWWLGLFWLTIIFGVAYAIHYHFIADRSPAKALARELAVAEQRWPQQAPEGGTALVLSDEAADSGAQIFAVNCTPCHGAALEGGIGPKLVDDQWIHGDTPAEIDSTITHGVAAKGMPAWGPILGAEKVAQVTAYVLRANAAALGLPFPPPSPGGAATGGEPKAPDGK